MLLFALALIAQDAVPAAPPVAAAGQPYRPPVIVQPQPIESITPEQMAYYFPSRALDRDVEGVGVVACTVRIDGYLDDCRPVFEDPTGIGFAAATARAALHLRYEDRYVGTVQTIRLRWVLQ
ncbi:hypothetical protein [Brevundimonas aveniformis]|uniref:hypothetical protein n=1 Tax=Brevundimonas aveniformis TaxID=370977 RepID=UPI00048B8379|nr:hypothetical protein [Brevundimonas aveniformis]